MSTLGDRISLLLEEKGLQQKEAAAMLHIKIPTFNGYVNNIREPNFETLIRLADFFGVSIDYLIGRSDDRHTGSLRGISKVSESSSYYLDDEISAFACEPANRVYIVMAMDIKARLEQEKMAKLRSMI